MELKRRKPNRLKDYDYSTPGSYLLTICTLNRERLFSNVVRSDIGNCYTVELTPYGDIAEGAINNISEIYPLATVDSYIIMPNHIHLLITIHAGGGGRPMVAPTGADVIVQQMKGYITKKAGRRMWQKSFYDHIVRSGYDYEGCLEYIRTSPNMWIRNSHYFEKSEE